MRGNTLFITVGMALGLVAPVAARPAAPANLPAGWSIHTANGGVADGTGTSDNVYQKVKRDKGNDNYDEDQGNRPPGWDRGNKNGWNGRNMPPGQYKKQRRNDQEDRYDREDRYNRDNRSWNDRNNRYDRYGRNGGSYSDRYDRNRNGYDPRNGSRGGSYYDRNSNMLSGVVTGSTDRFGRSITVRLNDGRTMRFDVPRNAQVVRYGRPISVHDIRSGDRVMLRTTRTGSNSYSVNTLTVY